MWEKAKRYVCKCGGVWCMLWIKWKIKDSESERERERDIDSELGDIEHWVLFFCVIYSQFSRSKGSVGHCWVIGASVATKKNTNQLSQSKQKANQVLIQCTQEVIVTRNSYRRITWNLPAGNILGILAVARAITIADLENCTNGATIFTGHTLQADVVLAAILGMCVTREGAGIGQLTGSGTGEAIGNLCRVESK